MQCIYKRYKPLCVNKNGAETTKVNEGCTARLLILYKTRYHNEVHDRNSTHIPTQ